MLLSFNLEPQRLLCLARDAAFVKQVCLDEKIGFLAEGVFAMDGDWPDYRTLQQRWLPAAHAVMDERYPRPVTVGLAFVKKHRQALCHRCGKAGHLKRNCPLPIQHCGKCGLDHCTFNHPRPPDKVGQACDDGDCEASLPSGASDADGASDRRRIRHGILYRTCDKRDFG